MSQALGQSNRRVFRRATCLLLVSMILLWQLSAVAIAWEQPAHMEINRAAVETFKGGASGSGKYRNAGVALDRFVDAPIVYTSGKFSMSYNQMWSFDSVASHIIQGGFSADEPNIYVSMKHFYDPLALSGKHELTDQEYAHGWTYEAIPAVEWALARTENPYNLRQAMLNYKKSLEIPSDSAVAAIPVTGDFRDFAGEPADLDEMRSMYLGKAMRGLGEVMHLVADMTQPSHVRNDSHPKYEITEQAITGPVASALTKYPRVDGLQGMSLGTTVREIMESLSFYTNRYFYSADTIADKASGVSPRNWETPYSFPNFSMFKEEEYLGYPTLFQVFGSKKVPMVRREPGSLYGYNYVITTEFALRQGEVLLPLAVAACTRTLDLFFPTLTMKQLVQPVAVDEDMLALAKQKGAQDLKQFEAAISLEHEVAKDSQWSAEGLRIEYSGPGELWRIRNGRHTKLAGVEFLRGVVVSYQDPETGEQVEGNPVFYMPLGAEKTVAMTGPVVDYTVEMEDSLYVTASGGARILQSDAYTFASEEPEIRLTADRTTLMPGEAVVFEVEIENPPERYALEWTFGDEASEDGTEVAPVRNRKTTMKHVYEKEDEYVATVRLVDLKRKVVRTSDSIGISSYLGELAGPWDITLEIQQENQFFRSLVVAILKFFINALISPISVALGGEPVDPSAAENYTMVGTKLMYSLDLRRVEESDTLYAGPLTYVGSSTDMVEGTEDIQSLRLEIINGSMMFIAQGVDDNGNPIEFIFLRNGRMTSPGQLEGDFNFPGVMSGQWTAVMR